MFKSPNKKTDFKKSSNLNNMWLMKPILALDKAILGFSKWFFKAIFTLGGVSSIIWIWQDVIMYNNVILGILGWVFSCLLGIFLAWMIDGDLGSPNTAAKSIGRCPNCLKKIEGGIFVTKCPHCTADI